MAHGETAWIECASADVEATKAHYAKMCGWTYQGMEMGEGGTYWVASLGDKMIAGIMAKEAIPHDVPPHWLVYLEVKDIAAAVKDAAETGGKILREPFTVPGVGQIAIVAEPSGAGLGLLEPAPQA